MAIESVWQDLRYTARAMRRSPGFTAVAVVSLALGIGANTTVFSLIDTLMLRLLPVERPEQLVEFLAQYPGDPPLDVFSPRSYEYFRDHNHAFAGITADQPSRFHVRGAEMQSEIWTGEGVAGNFFPLLGIRSAAGRLLDAHDDRAGSGDSAVAVLSWSCWKRRFKLDPSVVGRSLVIEDVPLTIVGVAPREFSGMRVGASPEVWTPLAAIAMMHPERKGGPGPLSLIGRLKGGVSLRQARAEMAVLFQFTLDERIRGSKDPVTRRLRFFVEPAGGGLSTGLRQEFSKPLVALLAIVGLLLLLACANLANLLLARGFARQREIAVRLSLGAGRPRIFRQLLTESLALSIVGALAGVWLAFFGADGLVRLMTSGRPMIGMPRIELQFHPDLHVLLFTAAAALVTALLFGLAPAWSASAADPSRSLRETGFAGETRHSRLFGRGLVTAQVALSVGISSAAGLFILYMSHLENADLGFRKDHVLLVNLDAARSGLKGERLSLAYQELLPALARIPGVRSATLCAPSPISGAAASRFIDVEGRPERRENRRYVSESWIAPGYFDTLGTPFLTGRDFKFEDRGRPRVAIVNEALSRYYFGAANPIGKHFSFDGETQSYEIVGVVGDAKYAEVREPAPRTVYLDTFQLPEPASNVALRTSVAPEQLGPAVRRTIAKNLPAVTVAHITTLSDQIDASIVPERLIATLSGAFGMLGSLLAAIGIYGLFAYAVSRRIHEIGIRMALGASSRDILRMVLREAVALTGIGLALGAIFGWWLTRVAKALMPDLSQASAPPIALALLAGIAIAVLAAYLPARRAARVDPIETLRYE